jgi:hypothetical protein
VYVPGAVLRLRLLSWNLGPGTVRWPELAAVLAGWDWDVAVLRRLPGRWALPLATALDAEFRYAPTGGHAGSRLQRLLSRGAFSPPALPGGAVDAILARRDRVVAEWPADARQARNIGVHAARLACGIWIGSLAGASPTPTITPELWTATSGEALVLAGPHALPGAELLTEIAHGGDDAIWATADLQPVSDVDVLAGGAVRGNPPLAVTLEHHSVAVGIPPETSEPGSASG